MDVVTIDLPELGNRCHLVHDGTSALVVDPPRDLAAVERAAEEAQVDIVAVADTHVHNDYVSGALALARRHGADYLLSADEQVEFERVGVRDGDVISVGGLYVRVIATPGHTRHHQAFLARPGTRTTPTPGRCSAVAACCTARWAGPTCSAACRPAAWLAPSGSAPGRSGPCDPDVRLHPTHGFGSFCAGASARAWSRRGAATIAHQRRTNPALLLDQDRFVTELLAGFGPFPSYYEQMGPLNRSGAGRRQPLPAQPLTADDVRDAWPRGRGSSTCAGGTGSPRPTCPAPSASSTPPQFATYVGWLVPWFGQLVLLTDRVPELAPALRDLAGHRHRGCRDARPRPGADAAGDVPARGLVGVPVRRRRPTRRVAIDVRERDEFEDGHLPGAVHLPVHEVETRAATLPPGELWVHCRSGYRAGIAASLLHRAGPFRRPRRRRLGAGRRARDPHHPRRSRSLRPTRGATCLDLNL